MFFSIPRIDSEMLRFLLWSYSECVFISQLSLDSEPISIISYITNSSNWNNILLQFQSNTISLVYPLIRSIWSFGFLWGSLVREWVGGTDVLYRCTVSVKQQFHRGIRFTDVWVAESHQNETYRKSHATCTDPWIKQSCWLVGVGVEFSRTKNDSTSPPSCLAAFSHFPFNPWSLMDTHDSAIKWMKLNIMWKKNKRSIDIFRTAAQD